MIQASKISFTTCFDVFYFFFNFFRPLFLALFPAKTMVKGAPKSDFLTHNFFNIWVKKYLKISSESSPRDASIALGFGVWKNSQKKIFWVKNRNFGFFHFHFLNISASYKKVPYFDPPSKKISTWSKTPYFHDKTSKITLAMFLGPNGTIETGIVINCR